MSAQARADCPTPTHDPTSGRYESSVAPGSQSTIAANGEGKFILVWQTPTTQTVSNESHNEIAAVRLGTTLSCLEPPVLLIAERPPPMTPFGCEECLDPSLVINANGSARVAFTMADARCGFSACASFGGFTFLRQLSFTFDPFNPGTVLPVTSPTSPPCNGRDDHEPSTAIDAAGCKSVAYSQIAISPIGLEVRPPCLDADTLIRGCNGTTERCFTSRWTACAAAANGYVAVVWADAEDPTTLNSPMNILMRIFDSSGNPASGELIVNQPAECPDPNNCPDPDNPPLETLGTSQESPAVAFEPTGKLVVVWYGPRLDACTDGGLRIFARQLTWDFTPVNDPVRIGSEFVVDNDSEFNPDPNVDNRGPNPTVAFSQAAGHSGEFVVMWDAVHQPDPVEVHGRAFKFGPVALGGEFRIHLASGGVSRRLGHSAQHTVVWTALGTIAATWTAGDGTVNATLLPDGYVQGLCQSQSCCRGDLDDNGLVNGDDIEYWVKWLYGPPGIPRPGCNDIIAVPCELDMNGDCQWIPQGGVPGSDWGPFICVLLTIPGCGGCAGLAPSTCCSSGFGPEQPGAGSQQAQASSPSLRPSPFGNDCNQNDIDDAVDIANGTSIDCNANGRPDECDVGFDPRVADLNANMIPDECEVGAYRASRWRHPAQRSTPLPSRRRWTSGGLASTAAP